MTAAWREQAACVGLDVELFFPPRNNGITAEVRAVCGRCPVRRACLIDALETREEYGVRGGVSAEDRRTMLHRGDTRNRLRRAHTGLRLVTA